MTKEALKNCQSEAKRLWLHGWWMLTKYEETCLYVCNGIGADWMGGVCKLIDWLLPTFVTASAIHDMRYWHNLGDRNYWDDEFEYNCRELLYDKYGFWHPKRWLGNIAIHQLRTALAAFGQKAWEDAGKRFAEVE